MVNIRLGMLISAALETVIRTGVSFQSRRSPLMLPSKIDDSIGIWVYKEWSVADDTNSSAPSPENGGSRQELRWERSLENGQIYSCIVDLGTSHMKEVLIDTRDWVLPARQRRVLREHMRYRNARPVGRSGTEKSARTAATERPYEA